MPAGVAVVVEDGFAIIDFVDPKLKGPGVDALIKVGGAATLQKLTREKGAPRILYRVPEGNAREAGLLDEPDDERADVTQFGGTDATGIVLPEGYTVAGQAHGPVKRTGTYRGGDTGDTITSQNDPVPADIAAASHVEVIEQVAEVQSTPVAPQGVEPGAYPTPEPGGAFIGMTGLVTDVVPVEADGTPVEPQAPADPVTAAVEATSVPDATTVVIEEPASGEYPEGEPNIDWRRPELNAYAKAVKGIDTSDTKVYTNKDAVLAAINQK